ncbi:hypothetical protein NPIL_328461 [Nephila pilipes]|uniref:Uncharacterized protein n=1 Tax=Nephila pilipes TaxID=299642 RepID=A0A8X6NUC3_NEPPI|nr:hypothetical protein NPIL_328461 [Nephila pilipes]
MATEEEKRKKNRRAFQRRRPLRNRFHLQMQGCREPVRSFSRKVTGQRTVDLRIKWINLFPVNRKVVLERENKKVGKKERNGIKRN